MVCNSILYIFAKVQQFPVFSEWVRAARSNWLLTTDAYTHNTLFPSSFVEVRILSDTWYSGWKQHPGWGQSLHPLCNSSCGNWVRIGRAQCQQLAALCCRTMTLWKRRSLCPIQVSTKHQRAKKLTIFWHFYCPHNSTRLCLKIFTLQNLNSFLLF